MEQTNPPPLVSGLLELKHASGQQAEATPMELSGDGSFHEDSGPKQLIVNYIPPNITDTELHQLFERFGPLECARVIYDKQTRLTKGFGFVYFVHSKDAAEAIRGMNGYEISGKWLKVGYAVPQRPYKPSMSSSANSIGMSHDSLSIVGNSSAPPPAYKQANPPPNARTTAAPAQPVILQQPSSASGSTSAQAPPQQTIQYVQLATMQPQQQQQQQVQMPAQQQPVMVYMAPSNTNMVNAGAIPPGAQVVFLSPGNYQQM